MATGTCPSCKALVLPSYSHCPGCGMRLGGSPRAVPGAYTQQAGDRGAPSAYAGYPTSGVALQSGMLLAGRYRLDMRLGKGEMGEVWRGVDEKLGYKQRAIKQVLLGGVTPEEEAERRAWFEREAALLAGLSHPNICDILDVVEDDGCSFLILELIQGRTLAEELQARGTPGLPEAEVLGWARQLGDALAYLHAQAPPIIFRDLKPQNIMLRPDGRVALIDFGIARPLIATGGTTIGTPGYAPAEQY